MTVAMWGGCQRQMMLINVRRKLLNALRMEAILADSLLSERQKPFYFTAFHGPCRPGAGDRGWGAVEVVYLLPINYSASCFG